MCRNPKPGVSVVAYEKQTGKILLCKRHATSSFGDMWCLPCGYIDLGETHYQAIVREVKEESGFDIALEAILNVYSNRFSGPGQTVVILFKAVIVGGAFVENNEVSEIKFIQPHEYINYQMAFEADKKILEELATNIANVRGQLNLNGSEPKWGFLC